ncbi:MAG: hypothetical protein K1X88_09895 [Nannocystaceae bacterium]|nr:hypothetical protein [Nannocystaceae bacterium]
MKRTRAPSGCANAPTGRGRAALAIARELAIAVTCAGCGDEVVGYFDGSGSGSSEGLADASGSVTASTTSSGGVDGTGSGSSDGSSSGDASGDPGFVPPGCFGDDFDNGVIDALWNTWAEQDASFAEVGGQLEFTAPTTGVWDTGVVGAYDYRFPFSVAQARMRVSVPPDPAVPVLVFLSVIDDLGNALSMQLGNGSVFASTGTARVLDYREEFPMTPYPQWIRIRGDADTIHFEVSDDGDAYTELVARPRIAPFDDAGALIMTQTYADDPNHTLVAVDDFQVCVE